MRVTAGEETGRKSRLMFILLTAILVLFLTAAVPARAEASTLTISDSKVSLYLKGTKTTRIYAYLDGKSVKPKFSSTSKRIATVNKSGKITAKKAGVCYIIAKYGKKKVRCKVVVKRQSSEYEKAISKYNDFLKYSYVTFQDSGRRKQADNFFSLDVDGNGIPELFAAAVYGPDRWYVMYTFEDGKMSFGQRIGAGNNFSWYPKAKVLGYQTFVGNKAYYHYTQLDDGELVERARVTVKGKKTTYSVDGEKVSAIEFREAVDHDLLNFEGPRRLIPPVNTPANRAVYLH